MDKQGVETNPPAKLKETLISRELVAMRRLHELVSRLLVSHDSHTTLVEVLDAAIELSGAEMGHVQLADASTKSLIIVAHRGFGPEFLNRLRVVGADSNISCGRAFRQRKRVVIENVETDAGYEPHLDTVGRAGFRSVQSTPLMDRGGEVLGVFSTHFRNSHRPCDHELETLDLYARWAADAIERVGMEESLRDAGRKKGEFLALLAHELRNPLASLYNGLQVVRLTSGRVIINEVWEMMNRQLSHMARLIDDLLDISRISQGKLRLQKSRIMLGDVIAAAVETALPAIEAARHELTVRRLSAPVFLDADPVRLAQVFTNLLTNSAKFTPHGGRIWVAAERQGADVCVTVRDTGVGIPMGSLPHVFDMFFQADRSSEPGARGLGIGLALVKRLVEMHGGTVVAESEGEEKGSVFTVTLGVEEGPAPAAVFAGGASPGLGQSTSGDAARPPGWGRPAGAAAAASGQRRPHDILAERGRRSC